MVCMGLTHCPLCVGLAVVSALRFCAHGWLLASLTLPAQEPMGRGVLQGAAAE